MAVGGWLSINQLKFNPQKTEFLWLGTGPSLKKMDAPTLLVDGVEVSPALTVRDGFGSGWLFDYGTSHYCLRSLLFLSAEKTLVYQEIGSSRCDKDVGFSFCAVLI